MSCAIDDPLSGSSNDPSHLSDEVLLEPNVSLPFHAAIPMTTSVISTLTISGCSTTNQKAAIIPTLMTKLSAYMTRPKGVLSFIPR